jgi:hypothetical protein
VIDTTGSIKGHAREARGVPATPTRATAEAVDSERAVVVYARSAAFRVPNPRQVSPGVSAGTTTSIVMVCVACVLAPAAASRRNGHGCGSDVDLDNGCRRRDEKELVHARQGEP